MRDKKPFNDVTDHYSKHVGMPTKKVEMKKLPKPLRLIGYFLFSGMMVVAILSIVVLIMTYL